MNHLLQPLDIGVFKELKNTWYKVITQEGKGSQLLRQYFPLSYVRYGSHISQSMLRVGLGEQESILLIRMLYLQHH